MLYTHVTGGLGNQMFIYAVARSIAIKNNTEFKLDISAFETYKRPFWLDKFNIQENYANEADLKIFQKKLKKNTLPYLLEKIKPFKLKTVWEEKDYFAFNEKITVLPKNKDIMLNGYWQNEKYFFDIRDMIVKELTLKDENKINNPVLLEKINNSDSVSLHIRRTDSLVKTDYGVMPISYYEDAIKHINQKYKNIHLFVFSDDIKWAEANLKFDFPTTFVSNNEGLEDYQELVVMGYCKHNVIANSSFSWWSAWLNQYPDKIVIAPKIWFADGRSNTGLIPETWLEM